MIGSMLQRRNRLPRPRNTRTRLGVRILESIVLILVGLGLGSVSVQAFQASIGDGTLGTYTVTGINARQVLQGTFISANRHLVIKNMGYNGNPPLSVGTTVKAIKPSWSWLGINGESVYGPGPNSADIAWIAISGVVVLAGLIFLARSIRSLIRAR